MNSSEFIDYCINFIRRYYSNDLQKIIDKEDIYCVWNCKTLQNNKGLFSTTVPDTRYFEITYNGDKEEFYFDSYIKEVNKCLKIQNQPIVNMKN